MFSVVGAWGFVSGVDSGADADYINGFSGIDVVVLAVSVLVAVAAVALLQRGVGGVCGCGI